MRLTQRGGHSAAPRVYPLKTAIPSGRSPMPSERLNPNGPVALD